MAYLVYLDNLLLPIAPSKLQLKINNQNKSMTLINDGEVNILKQAGLTDIDFEVLLPQVRYPFATYENGFQPASIYLTKLKELKKGKLPFRFVVTRILPNGKMLFGTDMNVSLEDYKITEDVKNGFDVMVDIKLKEFRGFATKIWNVTATESGAKISIETQRKDTSHAAKGAKSHTVSKGDCLYNIARTYYGNGAKYTEIYQANKATIDSKNKGTGNAKYTIYPKQVLTIPG